MTGERTGGHQESGRGKEYGKGTDARTEQVVKRGKNGKRRNDGCEKVKVENQSEEWVVDEQVRFIGRSRAPAQLHYSFILSSVISSHFHCVCGPGRR